MMSLQHHLRPRLLLPDDGSFTCLPHLKLLVPNRLEQFSHKISRLNPRSEHPRQRHLRQRHLRQKHQNQQKQKSSCSQTGNRWQILQDRLRNSQRLCLPRLCLVKPSLGCAPPSKLPRWRRPIPKPGRAALASRVRPRNSFALRLTQMARR